MPLLEISSVQPSFHIHLGTSKAQSHIDGKAISSSFIFRSGKRLVSSWRSLNLPFKLHGDVGSFRIRRGRIFITAVATFETESSVKKGSENSWLDVDSSSMQLESANKDLEEMDEKERLRRMRISKANKGITPWNKGRKHSAETRERIRERTRIAMQNSKVKMKLANYVGHAQSDETKEKIAAAVRRRWERRREELKLQESCHFEWQNLIAEASRTGFAGEDELQWDSYNILKEQIHKEWVESVKQRKTTKPKGCTRAPKSQEQRRKIAVAIAAKWANPEYRERIFNAKSRNRATTVGVERKPRIKQSNDTQSPVQNRPKKKASVSQNHEGSETKSKTEEVKKRNAKYKDPLASSKLEMIKNIREQRAAAETRKTEAIERARALIAEAEMAMNALELAAEKSPIARASLVETRKIIAEAIRSLESLKMRQVINEKNGEEPSDASIETDTRIREGNNDLMNHAGHANINGTQTMASSQGENSDYGNVLYKEFVSSRSRREHSLPRVNIEDVMKQSGTSPIEQPSPNGNIMFEKNPSQNGVLDKTTKEETPKSSTKTKKWVRGRLVEVSEEEEEVSEQVEDWSLSEEEEWSEEIEDWSLSEEEMSEVEDFES